MLLAVQRLCQHSSHYKNTVFLSSLAKLSKWLHCILSRYSFLHAIEHPNIRHSFLGISYISFYIIWGMLLLVAVCLVRACDSHELEVTLLTPVYFYFVLFLSQQNIGYKPKSKIHILHQQFMKMNAKCVGC